jgi:hypothetical protein
MKPISVSQFGKDHWSMLAYVEHCCVNGMDGFGRLDRRRLRCIPAKRPMLAAALASDIGWKLEYSTRLKGFSQFEGRDDPEKAIAAGVQLRDHDDWDCLDDLEAAGLVEIQSLVNGVVNMTKRGSAVAGQLRAHKASGGQFADFSLASEDQAA